jgi:integrase
MSYDVRQALTALAQDQSSATVAIAHNALTRTIRHAESRDLVRRNVSALIDTPKGQTGRPSRAMTLDQARRLVEVAGDLTKHRLGAYVTLCLQTGIRTEEAWALTWQHVDLDGKPDQDPAVPPSIAVWRSVRLHGDTKTRTSRRTLGLPLQAAEVLREHRARQEKNRQKAGDSWKEHDLVFCTGIGTPLDAGNIRRQFRGDYGCRWPRSGLDTAGAPPHLRVSAIRHRDACRGDSKAGRSFEHADDRSDLPTRTPTGPHAGRRSDGRDPQLASGIERHSFQMRGWLGDLR